MCTKISLRTKRIFDNNVAQCLLERHCQIVKLQQDKYDSSKIIFIFLDNEHFREQLTNITQELKMIKGK